MHKKSWVCCAPGLSNNCVEAEKVIVVQLVAMVLSTFLWIAGGWKINHLGRVRSAHHWVTPLKSNRVTWFCFCRVVRRQNHAKVTGSYINSTERSILWFRAFESLVASAPSDLQRGEASFGLSFFSFTHVPNTGGSLRSGHHCFFTKRLWAKQSTAWASGNHFPKTKVCPMPLWYGTQMPLYFTDFSVSTTLV